MQENERKDENALQKLNIEMSQELDLLRQMLLLLNNEYSAILHNHREELPQITGKRNRILKDLFDVRIVCEEIVEELRELLNLAEVSVSDIKFDGVMNALAQVEPISSAIGDTLSLRDQIVTLLDEIKRKIRQNQQLLSLEKGLLADVLEGAYPRNMGSAYNSEGQKKSFLGVGLLAPEKHI